MDLLRSCYATQMIFTYDSDVPVSVEWFFCDEHAVPFPFPHRFGSGNWASSKDDWFGVGEVQGAPRPWRNGRTLPPPRRRHFCGTPDQFLGGASTHDRNLCIDADGLASCCAEEDWCCDFAQVHHPETLPLRVLAIRNPLPDEDTPIIPTELYLVQSGDDWGYVGEMIWPPFGHAGPCQPTMLIMLCDYKSLIMRGQTQMARYPAIRQRAEPMGGYWEKFHPFSDCIEGPVYDVEWDMIIGTPPPIPQPPGFTGYFPIGLFPPGYFGGGGY